MFADLYPLSYLKQSISQHPLPSAFEQLLSKNGNPILRYEGLYLHSKYRPDEEGARWVEEQCKTHPLDKPNSTIILLGIGLGYHVDALLQRCHCRIILIELVSGMLQALVSLRNPSWAEDVLICNTQDKTKIISFLESAIHEDEASRTQILIHPTLTKPNAQMYATLFEQLTGVLKRKIQNHLTTLGFGYRWHANILQNLSHLKNVLPLTSGLLVTSKPVVILGAGPSLDEHRSMLQHHRKEITVIATAPTLGFLHQLNLVPDWVVSVDPGYANRHHTRWLNRFSEKPTRILTTLSAHPDVFEYFQHAHYLFHTGLPLEQLLLSCSNVPYMPIQGTVTMAALQFAIKYSTLPIILLGTDFSFVRGMYHYHGNAFEEQLHLEAHRMKPMIHSYLSYLARFASATLPAHPKGTVCSNAAMAGYGEQMDQFIQSYNHRVISCPHGGMRFNHITQDTFSNALKKAKKQLITNASHKPADSSLSADPMLQIDLSKPLNQFLHYLESVIEMKSFDWLLDRKQRQSIHPPAFLDFLLMHTAKLLHEGTQKGWNSDLDSRIHYEMRKIQTRIQMRK